jgi:hypothetical protein
MTTHRRRGPTVPPEEPLPAAWPDDPSGSVSRTVVMPRSPDPVAGLVAEQRHKHRQARCAHSAHSWRLGSGDHVGVVGADPSPSSRPHRGLSEAQGGKPAAPGGYSESRKIRLLPRRMTLEITSRKPYFARNAAFADGVIRRDRTHLTSWKRTRRRCCRSRPVMLDHARLVATW